MKYTILILLASFTVTHAELKLPAVIGSHMVLQQGQAVPIWGPGQKDQGRRIRQVDGATGLHGSLL